MTRDYGVIVFTCCDGEPVDTEILRKYYPGLPDNDGFVWGRWRPAGLDELIKTWPARPGSKPALEGKVWWQPSLDELRIARRAARAFERRRSRL